MSENGYSKKNLRQKPNDGNSCVYTCREAARRYFIGEGHDNYEAALDLYRKYESEISKGVSSDNIDDLMRGEFKVESANTRNYSKYIEWAVTQMQEGKVVMFNIVQKTANGNVLGHAMLIKKIKYQNDFSKGKIKFMDPAGNYNSITKFPSTQDLNNSINTNGYGWKFQSSFSLDLIQYAF